MRYALALAVLLILFGATSPTAKAGQALKISPLRYDVVLASGEKKKGFVDVTNPSASPTRVSLSVEAFRQVNNNGDLQFYDDERVRAGILLDYADIVLGARETLHLAFIIDGTKLPSGDMFAAVFATAAPVQGAASQAVRVGSLLLIQNGTPSAHHALVESLNAPLLQTKDVLQADFVVKNTSKAEGTTGFSPRIDVTTWPFGSDSVQGPLLFAGRSRAITYKKQGSFVGIVAITAAVGSSRHTTYSLVATGFWRWLLPIVLVAGGAAVWRFVVTRKKLRRATRKQS